MNIPRFRLTCIAGAAFVAAGAVAPATAVDPVRLSYVGRYDCHCAVGRDHLVGVEQVRDHYAIISSYEGLVVVDLDDLTPGGTQTNVDYLPGLNAHSTATQGEYVFAGLQRLGGFAVVHFAPDQTLSLIDTFSEPGVIFGKLTLVGNRLYVPAHAFGIRIYDVTFPASPVLVGSLQDGFTDAFAIAVSGQTAYVADGAGGMKIVDITDETAPTITAGESIETTTGTSEDVLLVDQRAYVAAGGAGLAKYEPGNVA
ncbi:MAG: hypothetical protein GY715_10850, partial [Planctomycetes bacterium]|nr:hypothetical protein [Planctomycetota bacterium]